MWKVVTSSNLNLPLKLFFYSPILTNDNLLLKIYCENIVVTFLNQEFLFFILFLLSHFISSIRFSFLFLLFSSTHVVLSLSPPPVLFYFLFLLKNVPDIREERERGERTKPVDLQVTERTEPVQHYHVRAPLPLVLLPTTRLGHIGFFFFFFCDVRTVRSNGERV